MGINGDKKLFALSLVTSTVFIYNRTIRLSHNLSGEVFMEVQLQDLLKTIKKDGVETAQKEADKILADAEKKAASIIQNGKKEAESHRSRAQRDASQFESSAKSAVAQAGRGLLISVRESLQSSFDAIIRKTISENFSGDKLADAIVAVVKGFKISGEVQMSENQLKAIESNLKSQLGSEIKKGLFLSATRSLNGGFVLKEADGKAYYDFSDASISEVIQSYLSTQIAELVSIQ